MYHHTDSAEGHVPIVLLGNMCDVSERRQVQYDEGASLARMEGWLFFEVRPLLTWFHASHLSGERPHRTQRGRGVQCCV